MLVWSYCCCRCYAPVALPLQYSTTLQYFTILPYTRCIINIWFDTLHASVVCADPMFGGDIHAETYAAFSHSHGDVINWHIDCLVAYSKRSLTPPQHQQLTREQRQRRIKLLRQYGANKQRIESYKRRLPNVVLELRIARLRLLQQLVKIRIAEVGGVPKRWVLDASDCGVDDNVLAS